MDQPIDKQSSNYQPRGNEPNRTWHAPKLRTIGAITSKTNGGGVPAWKETHYSSVFHGTQS